MCVCLVMMDHYRTKPATRVYKKLSIRSEYVIMRAMSHQKALLALRLVNHLKLARDAERLEKSFYEFCRDAWPQVDPSPFVDNWHLEDICNHLEAVVFGHIPRLLINEPPRTGKTFIVSVCLVAWIWAQREKGPLRGPQVSAFYASYAEKLSLEHSLKCRRLIESRWYQERWGEKSIDCRFILTRDTQGHFENDKGGYRMCSSVDAKATGFGADLLVADDPHLVQEAESQDIREATVRWWSETMPSRMNNRQTGAMIVVMQRVHEGDLSGHILLEKLGYVWICVPMSYVPCKHVNAWVGNKIQTFTGDAVDDIDEDDIFWLDPRTEEGELLWPERFPASEVMKLEKELGPYAFAGQYQQTPAPRGGGIIKEEWWQTYDAEAAREFSTDPDQIELKKDGTPKKTPEMEFILAALDTASTEKEENDPSALSIWGMFRDRQGFPRIMLMYCWDERYEMHQLVPRVASDCTAFNVDRLLIEDKTIGHTVSVELARLFGSHNFGVELVNPKTGFIKSHDKVTRLLAVVHLFAEGLVYAPDVEWADRMIKQCATVPRAVHDDLADTMSMALLWLRRSGWALRKEERVAQLQDETRFIPRTRFGALYPV
jgi:predicted phage terminase large subunit-like protein